VSKGWVQTAQGRIEVTRRVNAEGQVTGRVKETKKTYVGETWKEVEAKIAEDHKVPPEMVNYLYFAVEECDGTVNTLGSGLQLTMWEGQASEPDFRHRREMKSEPNESLEDIMSVFDFGRTGVAIKHSVRRENTITGWMEEMRSMEESLAHFFKKGSEFVAQKMDEGIDLHEAIAIGLNERESKT